MLNLLLSILSSSAILIIFKIIHKKNISVLPPIVINYVVATIFGFFITSYPLSNLFTDTPTWLYMSVIIGVLLIVNFFFIGNSTKTVGIAVTTIAAKMSFVLPVIYSLSFDVNDDISVAKVLQIVLACVAVFFVVKPDNVKVQSANKIIFPVILFFGIGLLDTLIKFSQYNYIIDQASSSVFSALNFFIAGFLGIILLLFKRQYIREIIKPNVLFYGTLLGLANFGSMFFLINALNDLKINNSLVFGINNIGIVGFSVLMAFVIFNEKFSKTKWIGLILSTLVLILMLMNF